MRSDHVQASDVHRLEKGSTYGAQLNSKRGAEPLAVFMVPGSAADIKYARLSSEFALITTACPETETRETSVPHLHEVL